MRQPTDERLDTSAAAAYLGVAPDTLKRSRWSGLLCGRNAPAFIKLGPKTVRYSKTALDAWLQTAPEVPNTAAAREVWRALLHE